LVVVDSEDTDLVLGGSRTPPAPVVSAAEVTPGRFASFVRYPSFRREKPLRISDTPVTQTFRPHVALSLYSGLISSEYPSHLNGRVVGEFTVVYSTSPLLAPPSEGSA